MIFHTTTDLQRNSATIARKKTPSIITSHGKPEGIMLPFFEECDDFIVEYMEAYEMYKNQNILVKKLKESEASGISSLSV